MSRIGLDGLTKRFGDLEAVTDVSATVEDGELLCLLGPSGCGKSTTLRMIGGLERPTSGRVRLDGEDVTDVPAYDRDTSIVFQNWELFLSKSVRENVAFGLKMRGVDREERRSRADELLERVEMGGYGSHDPADLSGGQKQRVALARSLAVDPGVLLLDEPLSNLDKRLRERMELHLKELQAEFDKTFIYVTHNQDEAFTLADRIGIMNDGRLVQVGEPSEVYQNPDNRFVEDFLGDTNFVGGTVTTSNGRPAVETELGISLSLPDSTPVSEGDAVQLSLRPGFLGMEERSDRRAATDGGYSVEGTLENVLYQGSSVRYSVAAGETRVFVERHVQHHTDLDPGSPVRLQVDAEDVLLFHEDGSRIDAW